MTNLEEAYMRALEDVYMLSIPVPGQTRSWEKANKRVRTLLPKLLREMAEDDR